MEVTRVRQGATKAGDGRLKDTLRLSIITREKDVVMVVGGNDDSW